MILNDIIEIRDVIGQYLDVNLNVKTSYKFMRFFNDTENDYNFFVNKTKEIIEKYAIKDENNQIVNTEQGIQIDEQFIESVQSELAELSLIEINIGNYFYFTIDELNGLNMSCRQMRPFIPYIIE